jgi:hypothetical protein
MRQIAYPDLSSLPPKGMVPTVMTPITSLILQSGPVEVGLVFLGGLSILLGLARSPWAHRVLDRIIAALPFGSAAEAPEAAVPPPPPTLQQKGLMQRIEAWGQRNPVRTGIAIGLFVFVLAIAWSYLVDLSSQPEGTPDPGRQGGTPGRSISAVQVNDDDQDGVVDSHDKCARVSAPTDSGCPRSDSRALHPRWGPPERWLAKFVARRQHRIDHQSGFPPCVRLEPQPRLASGGLTCTIRRRQVDFLRFRGRSYAQHYMGGLMNRYAETSAGGCEGIGSWEFLGQKRGRIAFLEHGGHFLVIWSYNDHGRVLGRIGSPVAQAAEVCDFWKEAVL